MHFSLLPRTAGELPGTVRLSGSLLSARAGKERLWFEVPENLANAGESMNAWLVMLLPAAFHWQEDLVLEGTVDAVLMRNVRELMRIWAKWHKPKKPVKVSAEVRDWPLQTGGRAALCFTGGVDSFFSLLHSDAEANSHPELKLRQVEDLVYVWGYDIPLNDPEAFQQKRRSVEQVAQQFGKQTISMATNLRQTSFRKLDWGSILHGPALCGAGHLLAGANRLLLSASLCYDDPDPWGSHPLTDPALSSPRLEIVHYGAGFDRFEKTEFISQNATALEHLHVCWAEASSTNCGQCEKCYRTLLTLEVLGVREKAFSLNRQPFSLEYLSKVWKDHPLVVRLYMQLRQHAAARGRDDVVEMIDKCLGRSRVGPELGASWWSRWLKPQSS